MDGMRRAHRVNERVQVAGGLLPEFLTQRAIPLAGVGVVELIAEPVCRPRGPSGSHKIEGIGIGFIPPLWQPDLVNEIQTVSTEEAKAMARRLASEEGIFAGTSTGANVVAAIRVAQQLGPSATVATIIIDSGLRYLSTDVYAAWT